MSGEFKPCLYLSTLIHILRCVRIEPRQIFQKRLVRKCKHYDYSNAELIAIYSSHFKPSSMCEI
jgi:L-lysine 2,3-aminomutase